MAYPKLRYPGVLTKFGLTLAEADVPPLPLSAEFAERVRSGVALASALSTEKARSEFIIAPVLFELLRLSGNGFGLFSGVEFTVDAERDLNGVCDFILTRSQPLTVLRAPLLLIAEAKNDNLRSGLAQCVGAMVAPREFNAADPQSAAGPVHGVVTTGTAWKFLRLDGSALVIDLGKFAVPSELGKVMGVLSAIIAPPTPAGGPNRLAVGPLPAGT